MKNRPVSNPGNQRGFTLIELIITLAIAIIVLSTAVPGLQAMVGNNAVTAAVNDMVTHLQLARTTAIMREVQVVLCPSADQQSCLDTIEWQDGFMVFADRNENRQPDAGDEVIRYHRMERQWVRVRTSPGRKRLVYKPSGMSPGSTATITVCDSNGTASPKAVILSNPGRPRVSGTRPGGEALICS
jgi:type IV fimbrial biogenesis protein FimT